MRTRFLVAAAVALAAALPARAAPVDVHWKLAKGDILRYRMTADQKATQQPGTPNEVETTQKQTIVWRLAVQEIEPSGAARIICRYEQVAIDLEQMMLGKVTWDSMKKEDLSRSEDPLVRPFAQLVGQEFNFAMMPTGEVTDVKGYDRVTKSMLRGLEDNPFAAAALASGFGDEWVRSALERAFAFVPPEPVEPGAMWPHESTQAIPLLGTVRYASAYTLESVEGAKVRIAAKTAISAVPATGPAATTATADLATRLEAQLENGGGGSATILFAIDAGRLESSNTTLEMNVRSKMKPPIVPADGPGSAAARVKVKQTVTVERLD